MKLILIVIRCKEIEKSKEFYETLGAIFKLEQHGEESKHYSGYLENIVFELYPLKKLNIADNTRLGFGVKNLKFILPKIEVISKHNYNGSTVYVTLDPDNRKVELTEIQS